MNQVLNFLFRPAVLVPVPLKPLGHKITRCIPACDDWMITQRFNKAGKEVSVIAFGRTWHEVQVNFQYEIEQEESYK